MRHETKPTYAVTKFLRTYFYLSLLTTPIFLIFEVQTGKNHNTVTIEYVLQSLFSILGILGFYGYIYNKKILTRLSWIILAPLFFLWEFGRFIFLDTHSWVKLLISIMLLPKYWSVALYPIITLEPDDKRRTDRIHERDAWVSKLKFLFYGYAILATLSQSFLLFFVFAFIYSEFPDKINLFIAIIPLIIFILVLFQFAAFHIRRYVLRKRLVPGKPSNENTPISRKISWELRKKTFSTSVAVSLALFVGILIYLCLISLRETGSLPVDLNVGVPVYILMGVLFGILFYACAPDRPFKWGYAEKSAEYLNREKAVEEIAFKMFARIHGAPPAKFFLQIEPPWYTPSDWLKLLNESGVESNDEIKFSIFVAASNAATKGDDYEKAISLLKQAVDIAPNDLVANYKLAEAYERMGLGKDAITYYKAAIGDPTISNELENFVRAQIKRIETVGPREKAKTPGAMYYP